MSLNDAVREIREAEEAHNRRRRMAEAEHELEIATRELLDAVMFAAVHGKVANGTTGALDMLARYRAAIIQSVGA